MSSPIVVYSSNYDVQFFGLETLHPFDTRKYSRAWQRIKDKFVEPLNSWSLFVDREASVEELQLVHPSSYLRKLRSSRYLAKVCEVPIIAMLPTPSLWDSVVLRPMRWATRGTIISAQQALRRGAAINLGGGYHHASAAQGSGFCAYSDIAISIRQMRSERSISRNDSVLIIDLDAHQGNGLARIFMEDNGIFIADMYNSQIFPFDSIASRRIDFEVALKTGMQDSEYISLLQNMLKALSNVDRKFSLAFFNAGTDVVDGDPLGKLSLSNEAVLQRDQLVTSFLSKSSIPWVMVTSGGYTRDSFRIIADSIVAILNQGKDHS